MKARKKPVVIECFKYDGDLYDQNMDFYVPEWARQAFLKDIIFFDSNKEPGACYIRTLEGDMLVHVGDYVIQGVNGELYPCNPDIFEKTYDIVELEGE